MHPNGSVAAAPCTPASIPLHPVASRCADLVREELDHLGPREALVLLPGLHDGGVVDAEDVHLVDPSLLKPAVDLGSLEARDLVKARSRLGVGVGGTGAWT